MDKNWKIILGILLAVISITSSVIPNSGIFELLKTKKILGENVNIKSINVYLTLIGVWLPIVLMTFKSIIAEKKLSTINDQTAGLLRMTKDSFYSLLRSACDNTLPK